MQNKNLPRLEFLRPLPVPKPLFNASKKRGYSKISAVLLITAMIVATALTFLLIQTSAS